MKKTFEHLLGLSANDALAILKSAGIFDVRVTFTHAPQRLQQTPASTLAPEAPERSALRDVARQFQLSEQEPPFDPLLEPIVDTGVLTESRVVGVRDDGRQLLVSRFPVRPKSAQENGKL